MSSKTITKNDLKAILEGMDIPTGSGSSEPIADTLAEFDGAAHINSEDMSVADIKSFVESLNNSNGNVSLLTRSYQITSFPSGWESYNTGSEPTVYIFGKIGIFTGALRNTETVTLNATDVQMFQLPLTIEQNCMTRQSWSNGTYHTRIAPDGKVYFARASNNGGTTYPSSAAGQWFPFTMVFPVKTINEAVFQTNSNVDLFYPVGSYYETSDTTFNPNTAWGGTWVLETEGQVHISAGENYEVGDTGGEETHTLTDSELPAISASFSIHGQESGTIFYQKLGTHSTGTQMSNNYHTTNVSANVKTGAYSWQNPGIAFGNDGAHNNMQPYIVVNRWHRIA